MSEPNKSNYYRTEAIEKLSSPERLDRLMQIVTLKDWLLLATLGSLLMLLVIWSIWGRIPITVTGKGILTKFSPVVEFYSPFSGQVKSLQVQIGECVEKDRVLAIIEPFRLRQQLQRQHAKLTELKAKNQPTNRLFIQQSKVAEQIKLKIAQLERQIANKSQILSPQSGCILELSAENGKIVRSGNTLGKIEIQSQAHQLVGLTYFAVKDGKKIRSGMPIQITPTTVKRERFGAILGKVTHISPFPVSKKAVTTIVGNSELVEHLIGNGGVKIQVIAELESDSSTFSGYKWSYSQGPELKISAGTTTTARIKLEERSPITFVLPILRKWSGIY